MSAKEPQTRPEGQLRLAVLIDADNAQASVIEALLEEVARFGDAVVRRIYGDFSSDRSKGWSKRLSEHAIIPQQLADDANEQGDIAAAARICCIPTASTASASSPVTVTSRASLPGCAKRG